MQPIVVPILQLRDESFHIGLNTSRHMSYEAVNQVWGKITKPEIDHREMKSIFLEFAPHLLEELEGLAQGLEVSYEQAAAMFSGYDVPEMERMGCSAILTSDYYVRNYDFSPALYDGVFSLIQLKNALASAGYNLQCLGRHDGVNQDGLVMGLHFVSHEGYRKGVSPWLAVRMVLDRCSSVDEAVGMLREIPHAACYNFSIGDRHGKIAVVEAAPRNVMVREDPAFLTCVNHFQVECLGRKTEAESRGP